MKKEDRKIEKLTRAAMMAALVCIATIVIPIPIAGGGYANAGDIVLLMTAYVLGPGLAAAAAGFGSFIADIILGYSIYAPGTFIIKGLGALCAGLVMKAAKKNMKSVLAMILAGVAGELVIIAGYYGYEYGFLQNTIAAAAGMIPNIIEGLVGIAGSTVLFPLMDRILHSRKKNED